MPDGRFDLEAPSAGSHTWARSEGTAEASAEPFLKSGRILGSALGSKKLHFRFFYKRLAYGILPTARIWLGRKNLPQQSNSDDEEG